MNALKIFFALILIIGVLYIIRNIASYVLYELETADYMHTEQNEEEVEKEHVKVIERNEFVKETNTSDLRDFKPRDANKVQNLNKRYNVGTYRGSDGRYKSLKDVKG